MSGGRRCSRKQHFRLVHMCCCDNHPLLGEMWHLKQQMDQQAISLLEFALTTASLFLDFTCSFCFPQLFLYTFLYRQIDIDFFFFPDVYLRDSWRKNRPFSGPFKLHSTQDVFLFILGWNTYCEAPLQKMYAEEHLDKCTDVMLLLNAPQSAAT